MTQLQKFPDAISNHFDRLFNGIGLRNSSFFNIDAQVHDGHHVRFLHIEFKRAGENLNKNVEWALSDFAMQPGCSAWTVWLTQECGLIEQDYKVRVYPMGDNYRMTANELRRMFQDWWNIRPTKATVCRINDDFKFRHLIELCHYLRLAQKGNLAIGEKPDPDMATRLETALDFFIDGEWRKLKEK